MRTIVMGAGVVGVSTAYYLAQEGHKVTVIERHPAPARETSFQNAGLLAVAHANAWASPRAPMVLVKSLWQKDAALIFRLRLDPQMWRWSFDFLRNCTAARFRTNTLRKLRICQYSDQLMKDFKAETGIAFDDLRKGLLYCFSDQAHFDRAANGTELLRSGGLVLEVKDRDQVVAIEPALASYKEHLKGALYCPSDGSGDARAFSERVAEMAAALGVEFRYDTEIRGLRADGTAIEAVITDKGEYRADNYVLSCGAHSPIVARTVGLRLPIYPIKGYTASFPCDDSHQTPEVGGVDEDVLVAWGKFGNTLRVGGKAEFAGYDTNFRPKDFEAIVAAAKRFFPNGCDWTRPSYWACLRPMTPDGPPIFGTGRHRNLFLNTGHGHIGWTMALGSARILADIMAGREPGIDLDGLLLDNRAA